MTWVQTIFDIRAALAFEIRWKIGGWRFREGVKNVQPGGGGLVWVSCQPYVTLKLKEAIWKQNRPKIIYLDALNNYIGPQKLHRFVFKVWNIFFLKNLEIYFK